jgi:ParB-like chromosome segregation protein Spo0J
MKKIKFPVMKVRMIPMDKIVANDYNPNKVAPPEMKLLKKSIEEDGYTMPIVVYYDKDNDSYVIVDGFHRYRCAKEYFGLQEIPATIIEKDLTNRMASTIRHNRARGTHQIKSMSEIVLSMIQQGWDDYKIAQHLGMDAEEVLRLKQITGLKQAFTNHKFSKSWEEFESNIKNNGK